MVRWLLIAIAFIGFTKTQRTFAESCSVLRLSPSRLLFQTAGRKIVFIGWVHNMGPDQDDAIDTLAAAEIAVVRAGCSAAENTFEDFFKRRSERLSEGLRVLDLLETFHREYQFDHVGIELSPKELTAFKKPNAPLDKSVPRLRALRKQCPNLKTSEFHATFPGPEYEFAERHQGVVSMVGIEDDKIKAKVLKGLAKEALNYESAKSDLPAYTKELFDQLPMRSTPEQKQRVLDSVTDPKQKAKLQLLIDANEFATNTLEERDRAMIQNLLNSQGNFAVVIGAAHIADFERLLTKTCP